MNKILTKLALAIIFGCGISDQNNCPSRLYQFLYADIAAYGIDVVLEVGEISKALRDRFVCVLTKGEAIAAGELNVETLELNDMPDITERRTRRDQIVGN